jgi:hypothetical protein
MTVETPPAAEPSPPATPPAPDAPLGDGGTAALKAERERADKLEKELKKRDADLEKARIASLDENARAIEEAKAAVKTEVTAEYEARMMGLRVQARAGAFHDPELVVGLLTLPEGATNEEIDQALATVATEKPYLVKSPNALPAMPQGPRGSGAPTEGDDDWLTKAVNAKRFG